MTRLRQYPRAWCADECGKRVILNRWTIERGGACDQCYRAAVERMDRDHEQRSLRRYTDEERARI